MYNPDLHYHVHVMHLEDLYKEAQQARISAALPRRRHARLYAAADQLGDRLVRLGTWLVGSAQRDQRLARW